MADRAARISIGSSFWARRVINRATTRNQSRQRRGEATTISNMSVVGLGPRDQHHPGSDQPHVTDKINIELRR